MLGALNARRGLQVCLSIFFMYESALVSAYSHSASSVATIGSSLGKASKLATSALVSNLPGQKYVQVCDRSFRFRSMAPGNETNVSKGLPWNLMAVPLMATLTLIIDNT